MGTQEDTFPVMAAGDDPLLKPDDEETLLGDESAPSKESQHIIKPTRCNGCTVIVEPMLFLFMLSQYPLMILMPQYYQRREWESLMGNTSYPASANACQPSLNSTADPIRGNLTLANSAASLFGLQSQLISAIPAVVTVMFIGPYSDKAGRKYALILPIVGQCITSLNTLLNVYFHLPLQLVLIGSFIYGCCGYWVTFFMGSISYITDITPKAGRSFRIVMAEICVFAPTILSSAGSGFWVETLGFSMVFLTIFLCNIAILLYTIFLIPETIVRDPTAKFLTLHHLKRGFMVFAVDDGTKRRWKLLTLLLAVLLYMSMSIGGVETYFEMNEPLCWGSVLIGIFSAINIGVSVIGSAISAKILGIFLRDVWLTVCAALLSTSGQIYRFFVVSTLMMFSGAAFNIMAVIFIPTIRAMISKLVQPNEIGAAFSGVAVIEVLCGLVGSVVLNPIYSATTLAGHPSAVFLVVASIYLAASTVMLVYALLTRKDSKGSSRSSFVEHVDV